MADQYDLILTEAELGYLAGLLLSDRCQPGVLDVQGIRLQTSITDKVRALTEQVFADREGDRG